MSRFKKTGANIQLSDAWAEQHAHDLSRALEGIEAFKTQQKEER